MFISDEMAARMRRSAPITNVARLFMSGPGRLTPNCAATERSASDSSGYPRPCFWSNAACLSTLSAEMPTRCAPTSANSPARSRKWHDSFVQPVVMAFG